MNALVRHLDSLSQYRRHHDNDAAILALLERHAVTETTVASVGHQETMLVAGEAALSNRQIEEATKLTPKAVRCSLFRLHERGVITCRPIGNRYTVFTLSSSQLSVPPHSKEDAPC